MGPQVRGNDELGERRMGKPFKGVILLSLLAIMRPDSASANACYDLKGGIVVAEDGTYLGKIADHYDPDSIFNKLGVHGSRFSDESIWNIFGEYGGKFGQHSPFNLFGTPPLILRNQVPVAYLSSNKALQGAVDPVLIAIVCYGLEDYAQLRP